jgi:uncharacterized protein (TIGR00251 family)
VDELADLRGELARGGSVLLSVKVVPKSSRSEIVGRAADGALKVKVVAVPERGRANAELCALLAREIGVPKSHVRVETGHSSPRKRVRIQPKP